ncbi:MAG: IPT/TIG domain-containing protein, partial [Tepidiformaceae bacterium]
MQIQNRTLVRPGIILAVLFAALFAAGALPALAAAPTITDVSPDTGSTAGGDAVVITGTGF